jgi:hypothetical protein
MTTSISGTGGITFPDGSVQPAAASPYVNKNRIINGSMVVDQRNAGASFSTVAGAVTYTLDRWAYYAAQASKFTVQQTTTVPVGFSYSSKITSLSSYAVLAGDDFVFLQTVEGYNMADLEWGTANAKTVTLSFWVRSSLTGTFGGSLRNSAINRAYPFSYTISVANTWEQKTITVAGDTSGTWLTTNGVGIYLAFGLGVGTTLSGTAGAWVAANLTSSTGATSVVGTNGATWYVTGVQLEIGTTATPFERRLYNQELANCQRYFIKITDPGADGVAAGGNSARNSFFLPVTMRAAPTVLASGTFNFYNGGATSTGTVSAYYPGISAQIVQVDFSLVSPFTTSQAVVLYTNGGSNFVSASAEL